MCVFSLELLTFIFRKKKVDGQVEAVSMKVHVQLMICFAVSCAESSMRQLHNEVNTPKVCDQVVLRTRQDLLYKFIEVVIITPK